MITSENLKKMHLILGINSEDFNKEYIQNVTKVYSDFNIHLGIMGPNIENISKYIPKEGINSVIKIESLGFNYALPINVILKQLKEKISLETPIALLDDWSIFSPLQTFKWDIKKNIDYNKEFVIVNTMYNNIDKILNLNIKHPYNSISKIIHENLTLICNLPKPKSKGLLKRTIISKKFMIKQIKHMKLLKLNPLTDHIHIPIVITNLQNLTDIEHGLEEELFSSCSRLHLIHQLKNIGLKKLRPKENIGLYLKPYSNEKNHIQQKDLDNVDTLNEKRGHSIFSPSNYEIEWGNSSKIIFYQEKNNIPFWNLNTLSPINKIKGKIKIKKDKRNSLIETVITPSKFINIEKSNIKKVIEYNTKINLEIIPDKDTLILINSNYKDFICSTPLIKKIHEYCKNIDILTNDNINPCIYPFKKSFLIRNIYNIDNLKNLNIKKYRNIIKTTNCNIQLSENDNNDIINASTINSNIVESNYSIIDPTLKTEIPFPFSHYKPNFKIVYPDILTFGISVQKHIQKNLIWDKIVPVISKMGNNKNLWIIILSLLGEKNISHTSIFPRGRQNIKIFEKIDYLEAGGFIKNSRLFVTTPGSDFSWLGYGIKNNTLLLESMGAEEKDIPNVGWINKYHIKHNTSFDHIISKIWELI